MTEERLRDIAFAMEEPLNRLVELDNLFVQMIDQCGSQAVDEVRMYALFQRNLGPDLKEIRKLWRELCSLTGIDADKPPLKAVEE